MSASKTPESAPYSHLRWHRLSEVAFGGMTSELIAASSDDGIGILAKWTHIGGGQWWVEAMDTEGQTWEIVEDFSDGEPIPPTPPAIWSDALESSRNDLLEAVENKAAEWEEQATSDEDQAAKVNPGSEHWLQLRRSALCFRNRAFEMRAIARATKGGGE